MPELGAGFDKRRIGFPGSRWTLPRGNILKVKIVCMRVVYTSGLSLSLDIYIILLIDHHSLSIYVFIDRSIDRSI